MTDLRPETVLDIEHYLKKPWYNRFWLLFNAAWTPGFLVYYGIMLRDQVTQYDLGPNKFWLFLVTAVCTLGVLALTVMWQLKLEAWINYWERSSWELLRDKDTLLRVMMAKELEFQLLRQKLAGLTSEQPSQERLN